MLLATFVLAAALPQGGNGPVVINEFVYDDTAVDDREFVELFNRTGRALDLSGWALAADDPTGPTASYPIPAGTVLPARSHYVLGSATVPGVDLVIGTNDLFGNGVASLTLVDADGRAIDAVVYEAFRDPAWAQGIAVGDGVWGELVSADASPTSWSRVVDGKDTGNGGYDFRAVPQTPGATNSLPPVFLDELFDSFLPGQPLPMFGSAGDLPPVALDPQLPMPRRHLQPIPPSPQGGLAALFGSVDGRGTSNMLLSRGYESVVVDAFVYIDASSELPGERESWTFGLGTTGSGYAIPTLQPSSPSPNFANGNTGCGWTYVSDEFGAVLYLVDYGDGGAGPGAQSPVSVLGAVPIQPGVNDGWQRLRLVVDGAFLTGEFGDPSSPGSLVAGGPVAVTRAGLYVGYRGEVSDPQFACPFVCDQLVVGCNDARVDRFGWATPGAHGTPDVGLDGAPELGSSPNLNAYNLSPDPTAPAFLGLGIERPVPLLLGPVGGPIDAALFVDVFDARPLLVDPTGTSAPLPLPIPPSPFLCGVELAVQGLQLDPALGGPIPLAHSKALRVHVGPPRSLPPSRVTADSTPTTVAYDDYERLTGTPAMPVHLPPELGEILGVNFVPPLDVHAPFQPFRDFAATLRGDGRGELNLQRPGTYFVEVQHSAWPFVSRYMVCLWSAPSEAGGKKPEARYEAIDDPDFDVAVVEWQRRGDNCFADAAADALAGESRTSTVGGATAAIGREYVRNGNRPVDVTLVGHGSSGSISMGNGQRAGNQSINRADIGRAGTATQRFIDANRGKIDCLLLFGCEVGRGANGQAFLQELADALSTATVKATVKAYDQTVCSSKAWLIWSATLKITEGARLQSRRGR